MYIRNHAHIHLHLYIYNAHTHAHIYIISIHNIHHSFPNSSALFACGGGCYPKDWDHRLAFSHLEIKQNYLKPGLPESFTLRYTTKTVYIYISLEVGDLFFWGPRNCFELGPQKSILGNTSQPSLLGSRTLKEMTTQDPKSCCSWLI